jgi:hypothetical protein
MASAKAQATIMPIKIACCVDRLIRPVMGAFYLQAAYKFLVCRFLRSPSMEKFAGLLPAIPEQDRIRC